MRLTNAKKEMEYKEKEGFWNLVIVNDDLEKAYGEFKEVMEAKQAEYASLDPYEMDESSSEDDE